MHYVVQLNLFIHLFQTSKGEIICLMRQAGMPVFLFAVVLQVARIW
jgi:hypothetical protein